MKSAFKTKCSPKCLAAQSNTRFSRCHTHLPLRASDFEYTIKMWNSSMTMQIFSSNFLGNFQYNTIYLFTPWNANFVNQLKRHLPDICFAAFHCMVLLTDDVNPQEGFEWGMLLIFACEYTTDKSPKIKNKY